MGKLSPDLPADVTLAQWTRAVNQQQSRLAAEAYRALVEDCPLEELDQMVGMILVAAYLRHQENGTAVDVHEMNHYRASWLARASDYCSPERCTVKINSDLSVAVDGKL